MEKLKNQLKQESQSKQKRSIKENFLSIGIALMFVIFVAYSLYTFYPAPKNYEEKPNDCFERINCYNLYDQCKAEKNITNNNFDNELKIPPNIDKCYYNVTNSKEYKNCVIEQEKCNEEYNVTTLSYKHSKISFFILMFIGIIILIGSNYIESASVSSGTFLGGILTIIWSLIYTTNYWLYSSKYIKLMLIGLVLLILIYIGIKKDKK